ncbi:Alpha/Beta hydrolase protein [Hypoxylon trugodes]|uniref:Alpha/Beta hydrolase protein n=1 Tax=Hypoxylon trugodes TaxID=326681 RepID=UPI0021932F63|nr:Alpha/Beta hydrolase protein [Hypoxylon trugodes]KAI1386512.1 Alpha/Beta hydrolase protein [Hypoxylon trugodes]
MVQASLHTILIAGFAAVASARNCKNLTIPLTISSVNTKFTLKAPSTNIDVTNFVLDLVQAGANYTNEIVADPPSATVTGNYTIGATYCEPDSGPGSTLQVLTHGVAFDRSYWDFPAQNYKYSYINAALSRGYSVFFWDRLGLGLSSRGEAVNEIQATLEESALYALTTSLRKAQIPGITTHFDKIVHLGHSFGSALTYALTKEHPEETVSDGIVLTGFGQAPDYTRYFQLGGNWVEARTATPRLASYPEGYLVVGDTTATHSNFFAPDNFDPDILDAAYASAQPATVGELLTLGPLASGNNSFVGPVLIITGERDIPFCGGNCTVTDPSIPAQSKQSFPNASCFEAVIVPRAGHGLNFEYSAQWTYTSILDFVDKYVHG